MDTAIREADRQLLKHQVGDIELLRYAQQLVRIVPIDPTDEVPGKLEGPNPISQHTGD